MICDPSQQLIKLTDMSFSYKDTAVFSRISLTIHRGDYMVILGDNGSGKSTLLKLILGLLKPDKGTIHRTNARIGYIAQNSTHVDPLFPVNVQEVVRMGIAKADASENLITQAITHVSLTHKTNSPLSSLSGGERQRVMIARALVANPDILIVDEPTIGVDKNAREDFYALLRELNETHCKTIILVTHDRGRVLRDANHIVCVENGSLYYHHKPHKTARESFNHTHD